MEDIRAYRRNTLQGVYTMPANTCDQHTGSRFETSGVANFPPEGTRATPCYYGVASLPGRPNFNCTGTTKYGATILALGQGSRPFTFGTGAVHYVRLIGIEFGPDPTNSIGHLITPLVYALGSIDHIVFDQTWGHGNASDETQRFMLVGTAGTNQHQPYFLDRRLLLRLPLCQRSRLLHRCLGAQFWSQHHIRRRHVQDRQQLSRSVHRENWFRRRTGTAAPYDIEMRGNWLYLPQIMNPASPTYNGGIDGESQLCSQKHI